MIQDKRVVYLGDAFKHFFNHITLNIYQGRTAIDLMGLFSLVKSGYALISTIDNVLSLYFTIHDLYLINKQGIKPDKLFIESFAGDIPSKMYIHFDNNRADYISMTDAVNYGLINEPINSYQLIEKLQNQEDNFPFIKQSYFNDDIVSNQTLEILKDINCYKLHNLSDIMSIFKDLSDEYQVSSKLLLIINNILASKDINEINLNEFINVANNYEFHSINESLLNHPWIRLICAIIIDDYEIAKQTIPYTDVRLNNSEAYYFALDQSRPEICALMKEYIIPRYWLEKQALKSAFESLIGPNDLHQTLFPIHI